MPDIASEIFQGASAEIAAKLSGTPTPVDNGPGETVTPQATDPKQEVESTQDDKPIVPSATSGEKNDDVTESGDTVPKATTDKPSKAAENLRQWGEGWEKTAKGYQEKIEKEFQPLLTMVEEKFGGHKNLELAAELYSGIADEDNFDPEGAIEWLGENMPAQAQSLVNHIAKRVIDTATSSAIARTFGRELTQDEISNVMSILASSGDPSNTSQFDKLLKTEDLPESLKFDSEGNEIPQHIQDLLRHQTAVLKQTQGKLEKLESKITTGEQEAMTAKAAQAVEEYITENLSPIDAQIELLGLNTPIEGETPEIKEQREKYSKAIEILSLGLAGQDKTFQSIYSKALKAAAKGASNRVAAAAANDYSIRLQAKMQSFAEQAAEIISPLLETLSKSRQAQVEKTKTQRDEIDGSSGITPDTTRDRARYDSDDPFSKESIRAELSDMRRAGRFGR